MSLGRLLAEAQRRGMLDTDGPEADAEDWDALVARVTEQVRLGLVPKQLAFLDDALAPGNWVAASCARQCGKNHTIIRLLILVALSTAGSNCLYVNATYNEARRVMWVKPRKSLPAVLRELGLKEDEHFWLNSTSMRVTFANGSAIQLVGADIGGGWERLLGDELDLLVVDEAQKLDDEGFVDALDRIIPDLFVARGGSCVLIGTPEPFCVGEFYEICEGKIRPYFRHHHWTAEHLSALTDAWANQLKQKALEGMADDDPRWLRDKLGQWVRQDDRMMLPLTDAALWHGKYPELIPSLDGTLVRRTMSMEHFMGLDFGWTDSAALVVGSISREEGVLREVHSWKAPALDTDQLAAVVRAAVDKYGVKRIYADSADPKTIADLSRKWRLPVVAADKHNKVTWIQDMRAKARSGRFQILRGSPLNDELSKLMPDPEKLKKRQLESPSGAEDHCWDASRYLYRGVFSEAVKSPEAPMTDEERDRERAAEQRRESLGIGPTRRTRA